MSFNATYTSDPGDVLTTWTSIGFTVWNANSNMSAILNILLITIYQLELIY